MQEGTIDARQLRAGLDWQKRWGGRIGSALVHLGLVREVDVVRALGTQFQIPVVDLSVRDVPPGVTVIGAPARPMERK